MFGVRKRAISVRVFGLFCFFSVIASFEWAGEKAIVIIIVIFGGDIYFVTSARGAVCCLQFEKPIMTTSNDK